MAKLIATPYGNKSPKLLCEAMDAHTLLPQIQETLELIKGCPDRRGWIDTLEATLSKVKEITHA